jgi:hypothetical protein
VDGFGFHHGYFHRRRVQDVTRLRNPLTGLPAQVFDQGLGRSLWFVMGANTDRLADWIAGCAAIRQAHLWAGVGLAAAYAGGVDRCGLARLFDRASEHRQDLAQGVAFAAQARQRAGNPVAHTALACDVVWGQSSVSVARVTHEALADLAEGGGVGAYETWRGRIRDRYGRLSGARFAR